MVGFWRGLAIGLGIVLGGAFLPLAVYGCLVALSAVTRILGEGAQERFDDERLIFAIVVITMYPLGLFTASICAKRIHRSLPLGTALASGVGAILGLGIGTFLSVALAPARPVAESHIAAGCMLGGLIGTIAGFAVSRPAR